MFCFTKTEKWFGYGRKRFIALQCAEIDAEYRAFKHKIDVINQIEQKKTAEENPLLFLFLCFFVVCLIVKNASQYHRTAEQEEGNKHRVLQSSRKNDERTDDCQERANHAAETAGNSSLFPQAEYSPVQWDI